jgi:signal transduction histidine kinase
MQAHEAELRRLHDLEKSRADDLARVSTALTRSLTSGLIALDPDGRVVEVNQVGREILGAGGDAIGQPMASAFGESDFTRLIEQSFTERRALSRTETAAGSQIVGVTTVPLVNDDGALLGMLALFTDLTRIRDLEGRVREMQTLADLGEMSAGIAHELRNSLSAILGFMTMSRRATNSEEAARALDNARTEATQLNQAVEGLLTFARPMRLDTQTVDLLALMRDIAERFDDVEVTGEATEISGDPNLLRRAMENLVRNAVESVKQKGSGWVSVQVAKKRVTIEDSGAGLDPADVPRLLLPFQSDKPAGYGLGLPLARKIILLHDGTLTLTGRPGEGATACAEFA